MLHGVTTEARCGTALFDCYRLEESSGWSRGLPPIVKAFAIDWQTWDPNADEPQQYPSCGEPEDYIFGRRHNVAVGNRHARADRSLCTRAAGTPARRRCRRRIAVRRI